MPNFNGVWSLTTQLQYDADWPKPDKSRGLFFGGVNASNAYQDTIDYITIATAGNATDFGNLTAAKANGAATASVTRAIFGGGILGSSGDRINEIEYITIASTGNGTDFGDLSVARNDLAAGGSSTRGIFAGGEN